MVDSIDSIYAVKNKNIYDVLNELKSLIQMKKKNGKKNVMYFLSKKVKSSVF